MDMKYIHMFEEHQIYCSVAVAVADVVIVVVVVVVVVVSNSKKSCQRFVVYYIYKWTRPY